MHKSEQLNRTFILAFRGGVILFLITLFAYLIVLMYGGMAVIIAKPWQEILVDFMGCIIFFFLCCFLGLTITQAIEKAITD